MTDEQQLREQLETAVPRPPDQAGNGALARDRWRRTRRRRVGAVVTVAAVLVVGIPAVHAIDGARHDTAPQITGTVVGTGRAACRDLGSHQKSLGSLVDTRVVDSRTATAWFGAVHTSADPGAVAGSNRVDVCLFYDRRNVYTVVAGASGRTPLVVSRGAFDLTSGPLDDMQTLDELWTGGRTTTDAPFACPSNESDSASSDRSVTTGLPAGSTGALLCYDDDTLYSPRRILSLDYSDRLVTTIDAGPISYSAPNVTCGGTPFFRSYSIVFRYPTGTRTVREEECRGLAVGPYTHDVSVDLDQQFEHLLLTEGSGLQGGPRPCPTSSVRPSGVGDIRHLVAVRYCRPGGGSTGQVLTGDDLAVVQQWGAGQQPGTTEPEAACTPGTSWPHLMFFDIWGNAFSGTVVCSRDLVAIRSDGVGHRVFYPINVDSHAFQHLLSQLALQP